MIIVIGDIQILDAKGYLLAIDRIEYMDDEKLGRRTNVSYTLNCINKSTTITISTTKTKHSVVAALGCRLQSWYIVNHVVCKTTSFGGYSFMVRHKSGQQLQTEGDGNPLRSDYRTKQTIVCHEPVQYISCRRSFSNGISYIAPAGS